MSIRQPGVSWLWLFLFVCFYYYCLTFTLYFLSIIWTLKFLNSPSWSQISEEKISGGFWHDDTSGRLAASASQTKLQQASQNRKQNHLLTFCSSHPSLLKLRHAADPAEKNLQTHTRKNEKLFLKSTAAWSSAPLMGTRLTVSRRPEPEVLKQKFHLLLTINWPMNFSINWFIINHQVSMGSDQSQKWCLQISLKTNINFRIMWT